MIYEIRTYDLKPGAVPQAEEAFAEALPYREKYSPIAAFWHTDIGPLNQIIHVWGYESLDERAKIRAAASKEENWPPKITPGNILNMNAEIWQPAPFMRPMGGDQALGAIYEMRTYTYQPGSMPRAASPLGRGRAVSRGVLSPCGRHVHRVRRAEQVAAHLALQGPESPRRGPRRRQQDPPVAQRGPGPRLPGEQDSGPRQFLPDALENSPTCRTQRPGNISASFCLCFEFPIMR